MAHTLNEALEALNAVPATREAWLNLVKKLSAEAEGAVTVLYGGAISDGVHSTDIVKSMLNNGEDVRIIDNSDAAKFLKSREFLSKLAEANGLTLQQMRDTSFQHDIKNWLFDAKIGPWADASDRFTAATEGSVRLIAPNGDVNRIFAQTELPALLEKSNFTDLDGISRIQLEEMLTNMGKKDLAQHLFNNSFIQVHLSDLPNGNLEGYLKLEPGINATNYSDLLKDKANFERLDKALESLDKQRFSDMKSLMRSAVNIGEDMVISGKLSKAVNKLGLIGGLIGFMIASNSAAAAERAGNHELAKDIMTEWAIDESGSTVGGAIAGGIASIALGAAALLGAAASAPVAGAVIFGASLFGAILGADGATEVYGRIKNLDEAGKRDFFEKLSYVLFGDYTVSELQLPEGLLLGNRITLDTSFSQGDIVANAKNSIAWRYALKHLNTFVIEGDDTLYAPHNQNGELEIENFSEAYLNDRAEMLAWRLQFDKAGQEYTEEWNTLSMNDDWDFIDHSILVNGQPLKFTIDGIDLSTTANHQIVFGSENNETLTGDSLADHLYGGDGDDILKGGKGNDLLEGGSGTDTYRYQSGDGFDTLYDSDGLGVIQWNGKILNNEVRLSGSHSFIDNVNHIGYYFEPEQGNTGTLTIKDLASPASGLRLLNYTLGQLGLVLKKETLADPEIVPTNQTTGDNESNLLLPPPGTENKQNTLKGLAGDDYLSGRDGNDVLEGGAGNDWLYGGNDNDWLEGGAGHDYLFTGQGQDTALGGEGNDFIMANSLILPDTPLADSSDNDIRLTRQQAWRTIQSTFHFEYLGLALNNNTLDFQFKTIYPDTVFSGSLAENPDITYSYTPNSGLFGAGSVALTSSSSSETGLYHLRITKLPLFDSHSNTLFGQGGDDLIVGNAGNDWLSGGTGDDQLAGNDGIDALMGGEGNDSLLGGKHDDLLEGGKQADQLFGEHGDDRLYGNAGNDLLWGDSPYLPSTQHGNDWLDGGEGNDQLVGGSGRDTLLGGQGEDLLAGEEGDDLLDGGSDNDKLEGNEGNDTLFGGSGDDILFGKQDDDQLYGQAGQDILQGGGGDDLLDGGTGRDTLVGGDGNDTLRGGAGINDTLEGGAGNDTYLFFKGDGNTTINNQDAGTASQDVLRFMEGVDATDVTVTRDGQDLKLALLNTGEVITVQRYFTSSNYALKAIEFSDGISWDVDTVKARVLNISEEGDYITGFSTNDTINGLGGNDTILGGSGQDVLSGGSGNDQLYGGEGNDVLFGDNGDDSLSGGLGNDILRGGAGKNTIAGGKGNDTYLFGAYDGDMSIVGHESGAENQDTLRFLEGINPRDVAVKGFAFQYDPWRIGYGIKVELQSTGSEATLHTYFSQGSDDYSLGAIEFIEGTTWDIATINSLLLRSTEQDDTLLGFNDDDVLEGQAGNDRLFAGNGNDTLQGGSGNDELYGDHGVDRLEGGTGNDLLDGGPGYDTYYFNAGWGEDVIKDTIDGPDQLIFGDGIAVEDITHEQEGSDLLLRHRNGLDSVRIQSWFLGGSSQLDQVTFADGTILNNSDLSNNVPELAHEIADQAIIEDEAFSFQIPADTFTDSDVDDRLTLSATLADGSVLPDWLSFDTNSQTFSGLPPLDAQGLYSLKITATDNAGSSANTTFSLTVNDVNPEIVGGTGNDTLTGSAQADVITSGAGHDILLGGAGNDTLRGGTGSDWLQGGAGEDTLVLSEDASWPAQFIAYNAGSPGHEGSHERISITTLQRSHDLFDGGEGQDTIQGTAGNDALFLHDTFSPLPNGTGPRIVNVERFAMGPGDDIVDLTSPHYSTGDVELNGGEGDDVLWGSSGNDVLNGGQGNDQLTGGSGNDTYLFGRGDGQDIITNYDPDPNSHDVLAFGDDISEQQLWFEQAGTDLEIRLLGTQDKVTLKNWYQHESHRLDAISLSTGNVLLNNQVDQLVQAMVSFNPPSSGELELTGQVKEELAPVISASWQ